VTTRRALLLAGTALCGVAAAAGTAAALLFRDLDHLTPQLDDPLYRGTDLHRPTDRRYRP
jgi:hypothetical protein